MIQYFNPSNNESKMLEDLPKFEDSKVLQDELKPKHEVQNLSPCVLHYISVFFLTAFLTFQMKSLIYRMTMKLVFEIDFKENRNRQLTDCEK